jgi:hypothetical protein
MFNFWKSQKKKRAARELLRENLNTITVDLFYHDDPMVNMSDEDRRLYLKKFHDLMRDKDVMDRIVYLANKQANMTLKGMKDGSDSDVAGSMNINGICLVRDEIQRLGYMFAKESASEQGDEFNRFEVV